MSAFLKAFAMVLFAEMGDKSQFLVVALSSRHRLRDVLSGITVAIVLLNGLAVMVGTYVANAVPAYLIKLAAAASFLYFGISSLKSEDEEEEDVKKTLVNPVLAIAMTFFLSEMGDKTQLATMALAAQLQQALAVLLGSSVAMVLADSLGIWAGRFMSNSISEKTLQLVSATIFMVFATASVYEVSRLGAAAVGLVAVVVLGRELARRKAVDSAQEPEKVEKAQ
ncbi:MAG: TMEM165/GDT1 family protein [Bacillota bacterium]